MDEQQAIQYGGEQQDLEAELDQQPRAYELLEPGNYGNSGLRALAAVARHFRLDWSLPRLLHVYGRQGEPSCEQLARAAQKEGLKAAVHRIEWERLQKFEKLAPFLARLKTGGYVVVVRTPGQVGQGGPAVQSNAIMVVNPSRPEAGLFSVKQEDFQRYWTGEVLFLKRLHKVTDTDRRFGLGWFVPELWRQRGLLKNIVVAALAMHVLALAVPIFFQVVIDRVLVYQNVSTLVVITAGVIAAVLFDSTLNWLRGYFVLRAASRIDIRLARKTFAHLMGLPIGFFETSLAGVVTKHMQQASQIREFLTGRLLGTLLDLPALLVFLPLMAWYSGTLTFVVVAVTAALALIIWSMIGPYRRRLRRLYEAEASRQSLLVETVHGMRTIKTLNLEPRRQESWENAAADAVHNYVEVGNLSLAANTVSQFTDRALTIIIVVIGAYLVFGGSLSVGALVAFNMLATRVVGPVLQLIGLLNHYQEVTMSVEMLGEIMNRPTEGGNRRGLMPPLRGDIDIEQVTFRYPGTETPALRNVSVHIPAGKLVAIVGRSGSGKTTLSALLQGLYWAGEGAIKVDGHNIQDLDMTYLRGMSGAVPQEPFLFRGTVKENIRVGNPTATFEEVVNAARVAGADEFVQRLPRRYDTLLEEGAVNLSGGQKQRLSIARALLRNPKIIIFDEATSALDPESENVVVRNLRGIAAGRTTILISHRLRTISGADSIIVMDDGRIDAVGTHAQLLETSAVYNTLWTQQTEAAT